ncbi:helix-turn-helix domain-containing protein [Arsenicicoccus sp. UBA7492]|uniref:helix-turn-helix domain-containing protein n=1 Tax=Arsenicicoccus sp. UBA7492 TaxID=1946057 RepID=UPI002579E103|nr:helix-turn-helix domain-containing protein [Arsenicicoccus sp. UBA7492]
MSNGYVVELETDHDVDENLIDDIMDTLAADHVAVAATAQEPTHLVITLTLDIDTPLQAAETAVDKVTPFAPVIGFTVTPEQLRDQRMDPTAEALPDMLPVSEAAALAGVRRQSIYSWLDQGHIKGRPPRAGYGWMVDRASLTAHLQSRHKPASIGAGDGTQS